jgi:hypothetical protein
VIARASPVSIPVTRIAAHREESRPAPVEAGVPIVRLKVIVDEQGRAENAIVVDSCGDDRRDQAAQSSMYGKQILGPDRDDDGVARVAYATVAVESTTSPRLVNAVERSGQ